MHMKYDHDTNNAAEQITIEYEKMKVPTHSLTHSLTHPYVLAYLINYSSTHSLTYSLIRHQDNEVKTLIATIEKQDSKLAHKRVMIGELKDKLNKIKFHLSVLLHNIEEEEKEESAASNIHSLTHSLTHPLTH